LIILKKASGPLYISMLFIMNWGYGYFMVQQFPAETSVGFVAVYVTRPMQQYQNLVLSPYNYI